MTLMIARPWVERKLAEGRLEYRDLHEIIVTLASLEAEPLHSLGDKVRNYFRSGRTIRGFGAGEKCYKYQGYDGYAASFLLIYIGGLQVVAPCHC